jgi:NADPH:quinone reductase-like Zn-dependent oxidoreductase
MLIFRLVFWCLGGKNVLLQIAHTIIAGVLGNYTGKNIFYQGIGRWQDFYRFNFSDLFGRKPASLSFEQAAAMPLTTITAWEALFDRLGADGSLPAEDNRRTVLIIGGAGGGGSIAIQLAKKRAGKYQSVSGQKRRLYVGIDVYEIDVQNP